MAIATSIQNNSGRPKDSLAALWQAERAIDRLWRGKVQHETARVHHAARRRGGGVAAGGARAAARARFKMKSIVFAAIALLAL